ncbi:MoaF-related domain-containing protein [Maribacter algicola]|uniref:MoaF-related domain-containing protein n=1 Tax=Meishania litoralis TaxID=3434685 RepID=A0ACC7LK67_9FLAO
MLNQSLKPFILCLLPLALMHCTPVKDDTVELIHRTLEYRYDENVYHLTFDTDSTLHWQAMKGDETGLKGNEVYIAEWISGDKLFITWGEESGTGVSQVLDFKKGKVHNHLLFGRELYAGEGTFKILDNN